VKAGYYASWTLYTRGYEVADIPAQRLTHINYAFANISAAGEVVLGDSWADVEMSYAGDTGAEPFQGAFNQLLKLKARHPHLKTLISVGGWSWSSRFSDVALTADSRAKFARSAVAFITRYGFDGIDIDTAGCTS
jgi:chitinase